MSESRYTPANAHHPDWICETHRAAPSVEGERAQIAGQIEALLDLDAAGALRPHGVGGLARELLQASARLLTSPSVGERERHGWMVERGVTCVVCPNCAFTFSADHTDETGGYSCPSCVRPPAAPREEPMTLQEADDIYTGGVPRRPPVAEPEPSEPTQLASDVCARCSSPGNVVWHSTESPCVRASTEQPETR